jgi:hypothetical protein
LFTPLGWQYQHPNALPVGFAATCTGCEFGSAAPAVPIPWQFEQVVTASGWYQPSPFAVAVPFTGVLTR